MDRRSFMTLTTASLLLPTSLLAAEDYKPGLLKKHLAAGDTVFLDFKASWCTTCAAQERVIKALKQSNPAYDQAITFIDVDWDRYGRSDLVKTYKIPRRSTLLVLKGDQELGRIVAQTSEAKITDLMNTALAAATA